MWDEKQFFDDFVRESNQIQPSAEFVHQMKNLSEQSLQAHKKETTSFKVMTGVLAAAAVVGILFMTGRGQEKRELLVQDDGIYAEKEDGSDAVEGSVSGVFSENKLLLENALTQGNVTVKDAQGEEVTVEEREILLEQIRNAEETELLLEDLKGKEITIYSVEGDIQLCFWIVGETHLVIQDAVYEIPEDSYSE